MFSRAYNLILELKYAVQEMMKFLISSFFKNEWTQFSNIIITVEESLYPLSTT